MNPDQLNLKPFRIDNDSEFSVRESTDFSPLINLSDDAIIIKDKYGNILDCNQKACSLFNFSYDEMINLHSRNIIPYYLAATYPRILTEQMVDNDRSMRQKFINKFGEEFEATVKTSMSEIRGVKLWFEQIKFNQETLDLQRKIDDLSKNLDRQSDENKRFLSILAHELKGYLNSVLGFSELVLQESERYSTKEILHFVKLIKDTGGKGFKLLDNLLNWVKSQNGNLIPEFDFYDIDLICENVIESLIVQANEKRISIQKMYKKGVKGFCDQNMTAIVIHNLIQNAIKYSHPDSKIDITIERTSSEVVLMVKDYGIGIPESSLLDIFNLFKSREHLRNGTDNEQSTGFGLPLCKEFIESQHGQIWLESKDNKGTTAYFTLPIHNP